MRHLFVLAMLAGCLAAQNFVVSPTGYATNEGSSNNTYPFSGSGFRYQQVHGDLRGTPRVLLGMSWRRDGTLATSSSYGPRSFDFELLLGDGNVGAFSSTFATNFTSTPLLVFTRKVVNAPDFTALPDVMPAPWSFSIPFDVPYIHTAQADLIWEVALHANTNPSGWFMDATTTNSSAWQAGFTASGVGCTTSNGTMKTRANVLVSTVPSMSMAWQIVGGPSSAAAVVFVGLTNPNLPVPGLCNSERLYTDAMFAQISATTNATGGASTSSLTVPYNPAYVALGLTAQAIAIDASQPNHGVAAGNGVATIIPTVPVPVAVSRLFAPGSPTNATGSLGPNYGLVVRFRG